MTTRCCSLLQVRGPKGQFCANNHVGVMKNFVAKAPVTPAAALAACEAFCNTAAGCTACSVDQLTDPKGVHTVQWVALPSCGALNHWAGSIAGDVSQKEHITEGPSRI